MKARPLNKLKQWAVFAPDGYVQVRTISYTKKDAKQRVIAYWERGEKTWDDYARAGYIVRKIIIDIQIP